MARGLTFRRTSEDFGGFIWDEANRQAHLEKHKIDFRMALEVDWTYIKKAADLRRTYPTPRWVALAYCPLSNHIGRIISVRKANAYEEALFRA
jgi:uncharacterized DUF497 family protein